MNHGNRDGISVRITGQKSRDIVGLPDLGGRGFDIAYLGRGVSVAAGGAVCSRGRKRL